jgi:dethiobiotin synthetase
MDLKDDLLDRLIRTHRVGLLEFTGLGRGLLSHALLSLAHVDSYNILLRGI